MQHVTPSFATSEWPQNSRGGAGFFLRFYRAQLGIAIVEFALMLPILMTLVYGAIEVTRYILITQKVEKLAHSVSDVTAQSSVVTLSSLGQIMAATSDIMNPFTMDANGVVIVSSLYRAEGAQNATVNWRYSGGGTLGEGSHLGSVGQTPSMPAGFTFEERENVIAAEAFYLFTPLVSNKFFSSPTLVYRVAFYKPRLGALITPPV